MLGYFLSYFSRTRSVAEGGHRRFKNDASLTVGYAPRFGKYVVTEGLTWNYVKNRTFSTPSIICKANSAEVASFTSSPFFGIQAIS